MHIHGEVTRIHQNCYVWNINKLEFLGTNRFLKYTMITGWHLYAGISRTWACVHQYTTAIPPTPPHVSLCFTFAKNLKKIEKCHPPFFSIFRSISMKSEESNWDRQVSPIDHMLVALSPIYYYCTPTQSNSYPRRSCRNTPKMPCLNLVFRRVCIWSISRHVSLLPLIEGKMIVFDQTSILLMISIRLESFLSQFWIHLIEFTFQSYVNNQ